MNNFFYKQVRLEKFTPDHIKKTFAWLAEQKLRDLFLMRGELTWEGHLAYFDKELHDPSQRVFAIICDGDHVGNCGLKNLGQVPGLGEFWIYVGMSEMRGKGIGVEATKLMLTEASENFSLDTVQVHVARHNQPARRLYSMLGFVEVNGCDTEWEGREDEVVRMVRESGKS